MDKTKSPCLWVVCLQCLQFPVKGGLWCLWHRFTHIRYLPCNVKHLCFPLLLRFSAPSSERLHIFQGTGNYRLHLRGRVGGDSPTVESEVWIHEGTQSGWFTMENNLKMDDWAVPLFKELPIHLFRNSAFLSTLQVASVNLWVWEWCFVCWRNPQKSTGGILEPSLGLA